MKLLKIGMKLLGIYFFAQTLVSLTYLSALLESSQLKTFEVISFQILTVILFLLASVLLIVTPGWLVRLFSRNLEESASPDFDTSNSLRIGVILIGLFFSTTGAIGIISLVVRIIFVLGNQSSIERQEITKDLVSQLPKIVSLLVGLFLFIKNKEIVKIAEKSKEKK